MLTPSQKTCHTTAAVTMYLHHLNTDADLNKAFTS